MPVRPVASHFSPWLGLDHGSHANSKACKTPFQSLSGRDSSIHVFLTVTCVECSHSFRIKWRQGDILSANPCGAGCRPWDVDLLLALVLVYKREAGQLGRLAAEAVHICRIRIISRAKASPVDKVELLSCFWPAARQVNALFNDPMLPRSPSCMSLQTWPAQTRDQYKSRERERIELRPRIQQG